MRRSEVVSPPLTVTSTSNVELQTGSMVIRVTEAFKGSFLESLGSAEITEELARKICHIFGPSGPHEAPIERIVKIYTADGEASEFDFTGFETELVDAFIGTSDEHDTLLDPQYSPVDFRLEVATLKRRLFARDQLIVRELAHFVLQPPNFA